MGGYFTDEFGCGFVNGLWPFGALLCICTGVLARTIVLVVCHRLFEPFT